MGRFVYNEKTRRFEDSEATSGRFTYDEKAGKFVDNGPSSSYAEKQVERREPVQSYYYAPDRSRMQTATNRDLAGVNRSRTPQTVDVSASIISNNTPTQKRTLDTFYSTGSANKEYQEALNRQKQLRADAANAIDQGSSQYMNDDEALRRYVEETGYRPTGANWANTNTPALDVRRAITGENTGTPGTVAGPEEGTPEYMQLAIEQLRNSPQAKKALYQPELVNRYKDALANLDPNADDWNERSKEYLDALYEVNKQGGIEKIADKDSMDPNDYYNMLYNPYVQDNWKENIAYNGMIPARKHTIYEAVNDNGSYTVLPPVNSLGALSLGTEGFDDFSIDAMQYMSDEQKDIYNYIYNTQGSEQANDYIRDILPTLTPMQRERIENELAVAAKEDPVLMSLGSIAAAPLKVITYVNQIADFVKDGKIDQNAGYNIFSYMPSTVRQSVAEGLGGVGGFLYQSGMSMFDFLTQAALTGNFSGLTGSAATIAKWASLGLMGAGAAADSVIESKDRGMSDGTSLFIGTLAGAIEILSESFSLEKLLSPNRVLDSDFWYIAKNALAEGSEEAVSSVGNWLVDMFATAVTNEPTKFRQLQQDVQEGRASYWDIAKEVVLDFLGGAFSGSIMGSGGVVIDNARQARIGKMVNDADTQIDVDIPDIEALAKSDAAKDSLFQRTYDKIVNKPGKNINNITNREAGRLYDAMQYTISQKEEADLMLTNMASEIRDGNVPMNAELIAAAKNEEAVHFLQKYVNLDGIDVTSQNRKVRIESMLTAMNRFVETVKNNSTIVDNVADSLDNVSDEFRTYLKDSYDGINDPQKVIDAKLTAYQVGRSGGSNDSEMMKGIGDVISSSAKQAAFEIGRDEYTSSHYSEENNYGEATELPVSEGIQRDDGQSAGGQGGRVEPAPGGPEIREGEAGQGMGGPAGQVYSGPVTKGQRQSTKDFGVQNGTDNRNIFLISNPSSESDKAAVALGAANGVEVRLFAGGAFETYGKNGKLLQARGYFMVDENGKKVIYVRADHKTFTADQIAAHEIMHDKIRENGGDEAVEKIRERLIEKVGGNRKLESVVRDYSTLYTKEQYSPQAVLEEIICDAAGRMNEFTYHGNERAAKRADSRLYDLVREATNDVIPNAITPAGGQAAEASQAQEVKQAEKPGNSEISARKSIDLTSDALGVDAWKDQEGKIHFWVNGHEVKEITSEHVKDHSAIGNLIKTAVANGFINTKEANKQYKAAAELMNTIMSTQDPELTWAWSGAAMFSALKKNSDGQYGTTIDFTTVCRKTQEMVTAMSNAMMEAGRGLTRAEVVKLQRKVYESGAEVPCPVCYVFSRWAGVGEGVLDKIKNLQNKYAQYSQEEITRRADDLKKQIIDKGWSENGKVTLAHVTDLRAELEDRYDDLAFEVEQYEKGNKLKRTKEQYEQSKAEMKSLAVDIGILSEWTWASNIVTNPDYKPVPNDVLFNLDAGAKFASEYPVVWKYRSTRGPAAGKAILPYSSMRYGDLILGTDPTKGNRYLFTDENGKAKNAGEMTPAQNAAVESAIKRTAAQNLIGGQRFQSTSDFRYEYALDYIQAFWELQALGSKMQTYTKVVEFADLVAAVGGDVNLSVMPLRSGLENGKLIYSNVTGMNIDAALEANAKFDNAQLILVGINDKHILAALDDHGDAGGAYIGFVIPYHASGAKIKGFISDLVSNLGEQFVQRNYQDYSSVQTDKDRSGMTEAEKNRADALRDIRKKMLTSRESLTASELALISGTSKSIEGRSFQELRDIELRALAGDEAALAEYRSWSAGVLQDLYDKMYKGSEKDAILNSEQAKTIMPHEYWNTNTTRANAYINGFIFRSYCYNLGLKPRFSYTVGKGKNMHGDFSGSDGYWKLLIDRPMYDNKGNYRAQQRINVTDFNNAMLTPKYAEQTYPEYKIQEPNQTRAAKVGKEFGQSLSKNSLDLDRPLAPAFYSKLEREVENFKGDKIGTASAIQYLKGRGVKDEEIKWSGISTFLEGKKSVSKSELLDFLNQNRLEITEDTLRGKKISVIPEWIDELEGEYVDGDTGEVYSSARAYLERIQEYEDANPGEYDDFVVVLHENGRVTLESDYDEVGSIDPAGISLDDYENDDEVKRWVADSGDARWMNYSLKGGDNYREIVFSVPGSNYTNNAMNAHWGRSGVVAHARVQDFTSNGNQVLFVDEIQSDWHNAGAKYGYDDENFDLTSVIEKAGKDFQSYKETVSSAVDLIISHVEDQRGTLENDRASIKNAITPYYEDYAKNYKPESRDAYVKQAKDFFSFSDSAAEKYVSLISSAHENYMSSQAGEEAARNYRKMAKDAPYKNGTYVQYVLKNLLRQAAEGDYDYLAWTTGKMQEDRWSSAYAEGYRIEYDQDIPAFLKKYGRQWGATLTQVSLDQNGETVPAIAITGDMKDSVLYEGQPKYSLDLEENYQELYEELPDGRIRMNNVADMSTEDWKLIYKAVNKLGYGLKSWQDAKEVYSRYGGKNGFNKEQSDAIRKAYGVVEGGGKVANTKREALARKLFGTTGDFREAGYLMRNGSMLDFSGKKDGGPAHVRYMDHREISSAFEDGEIPDEKTRYGDTSAYMNAFISEGNIRLMDGQGVTIGEMAPTSEQYRVLKQFIERTLKNEDYFYLDLSNNDGYTVASRDYSGSDTADRIIRDIKEYFKNGELPYRSGLQQFRYSLDIGDSALHDENQQLRKDLAELRQKLRVRTEQKEYWKGQTQTTKGPTIQVADAKNYASELIKGVDSKADLNHVTNEIKKLVEFLESNIDSENAYWDAKEWAYEIADNILKSAQVLNESIDEDIYVPLRDQLKSMKIYVSPSAKAELAPDGWNQFQKKLFGTTTLTSDKTKGRSIDEVYQDLRSQYEWLFPEYVTGEADQFNEIMQALETYKPTFSAMNDYEISQASEWMADAIMTKAVAHEFRHTDPTRADKMEARLNQQKQKASEALKRAREQRDRTVKNLKAHYQEVAAKKRADKIDSANRTRLLKIIRRLNNAKLPRVQRALLDQYIKDIDTVAKGMMAWKTQELRDLKDQYDDWVAAQKKELGDSFVPDSTIEKKLDRLKKRHINDLSQEEVADLTTVLLYLENEIRTQNKLIDSEVKKDTYAAAQEFVEDYQGSKIKKRPSVYQSLMSGLLSPERMARAITGYKDADPMNVLMHELSDGQRKMLDYQLRAEDLFREWTNDKAFIKTLAGKDAKWITVKGLVDGELKEVKITPAMRMSLWLHSLNEQNLKHIERGGVSIPNQEMYTKGDMADAYKKGNGTTAVFSRYMIKEITDKMSDQEKAFAKKISWYFNNMSKDAINETSEKHKGFEVATVPKYFPIDTDRDFLKADFGEMLKDGTVNGLGFLKERIEGAANPIMLYDVNDVLTKSIKNHSKYYALAIPVRNINRLLNVNFYGADPTLGWGFDSEVNDVKYWRPTDSVRKNLLSEHEKYLDNIIRDVQAGVRENGGWTDEMLSKFRSKYAGGVLALNAGVALKQAASYPTAAAIIGYRPLIQALKNSNRKVDLDLIKKYTPLLAYRSKGYSSTELGDIGERGGVAAKMMEHKALNWIQGVDVATTTKLWTAAEYYVTDNNPSLRRESGDDAYYKEVAKVYNRIIEETQPNYTAMQRPGVLRSGSSITRALNMFKTQPFQNANILIDALGNLGAKRAQYRANRTAENKAAFDAAKKAAANAITSQALSAFVFSLMQFVWDMARGKTKKYKNDEDEMTFWTANRALLLNMLSSAGGMIPFGGFALEFLESTTDKIAQKLGGDAIFDQKFYGLSENSLQAVNDLAEAVQSLIADSIDTFKETNTPETNARKAVDDFSTVVQLSTGIPAQNIVKDMQTVALNIGRVKGKIDGDPLFGPGPLAEYNALRVTTDPAKYPGDYYNLLYKLYRNDKTAYETIYQKMIRDESGVFTEDKIKSNMESRMKKSAGVRSVKDLESRWIAPESQVTYDKLLNGLESSSIWDQATTDQQKSVQENLYSVVSGKDDKLQEAINGAKAVGMDENSYMLFQLAYEMADTDQSGGVSSKELAKVLEDGKYTDQQKAYLWKTTSGIKADTIAKAVNGGKSVGLDETEYLLYRIALTTHDDGNGSYTNAETEAAIRSLTGLTNAERAYLWEAQGKSAKSNPWK